MATLYKMLGDSYDRHDGSLEGYTRNGILVGNALASNRHMDVRAFHNRDLTVKWTMRNMQFWNAYHWDGYEMDDFNNPHSIIGAETRRRSMDDLSISDDVVPTLINGGITLPTGTITVDSTAAFSASGTILIVPVDQTPPGTDVSNKIVTYTGKTGTTFTGCTGGSGAIPDNSFVYQSNNTYFTMLQMNSIDLGALSFVQVSLGNEDWPVGDADVIIGRDSAYRYANTIRVNNVIQASTKTVTSSFFDDLLTDFNHGGNAFIELVLRAFPAQAAANKLDLANSFIDFSASETFEAGVTTSVAFNASLNSLTNGGDVVWKINRTTLLPNVALGNVRAIRFRLKAIGAGSITFIAQSMRMYEENLYVFEPIQVDTKKKYLMKAAPQQTENKIENSSFEPSYAGTGGPHAGRPDNWTNGGSMIAGGSTVVATSAEAHKGKFSLSVTTTGTTNQGTQLVNPMTKVNGTTYRVQAWVKATNGQAMKMYLFDAGGSASTTWTANGSWQQKVLTYPATDSLTDLRVAISINSAATTTFYVDEVMVSPNYDPSPGPYADSDDTVFGPIFYDESRPKNITKVTKFHSGHNPSVSNTWNTLRQYFRYTDDSNYIRVDMDSRSTECRLRIYQRVAGTTTEVFSTTAGANVLGEERDYMLITELKDNKIRASIYTSSGLPEINSKPRNQLNGAQTLPVSPITVDSTIDFPTSGTIRINSDYVTYTGKTGTTFTGCVGGTGLQADNSVVQLVGDPEVRTTGWQTVTPAGRGRVGYSFEPYNYDFYIEYHQPTVAEFAEAKSTPFPSVKNVKGATLYRHDSGYTDVGESTALIGSGDGLMSIDTSLGDPAPARKVQRDGTYWFGGLEYSDTVFTGNTRNVVIRGSIYPLNARGLWRVALVDEFGSVGFLGRVEGLLRNVWNRFEVPVNADLLPTKWLLFVQQAGFYNDTFYVDNLRLDHNSVSWEASANNGTSFVAFNNVSDSKYSSIRFPDTQQANKVKIKGVAQTDRSWISGYEIEPIYQR